MTRADPLMTACPVCGRRYLPARATCLACPLQACEPAEPAGEAEVLTLSRARRVGPAAVVSPPVTILLVREVGAGGVFGAPLDADEMGDVQPGDRVRLVEKSWPLPDGGAFRGIVARP